MQDMGRFGKMRNTVLSGILRPLSRKEVDRFTVAFAESDVEKAGRALNRTNLLVGAKSWLTIPPDSAVPYMLKIVRRTERLQDQEDLEFARLTLATARYRLDHDAYPNEISDLVPDYLEESWISSGISGWGLCTWEKRPQWATVSMDDAFARQDDEAINVSLAFSNCIAINRLPPRSPEDLVQLPQRYSADSPISIEAIRKYYEPAETDLCVGLPILFRLQPFEWRGSFSDWASYREQLSDSSEEWKSKAPDPVDRTEPFDTVRITIRCQLLPAMSTEALTMLIDSGK